METQHRGPGKDFSEAISNALRPPAVVLNFRRNEGLDLTGVWD